MAETNPSLHIDTDWKKQAQEEKRKLAEQEQQKGAAGAAPGGAPPVGTPSAAEASGAAPATGTERRAARSVAGDARQRELPPASFATLVQTLVTQAMFYLGGIATRGGEPVLDLDLAKHQIDLLGVLEDKTANNLTPDEKRMLDAALYESRMRYISVASQYIS
jgi:Domain of unknown function (DUF1844)